MWSETLGDRRSSSFRCVFDYRLKWSFRYRDGGLEKKMGHRSLVPVLTIKRVSFCRNAREGCRAFEKIMRCPGSSLLLGLSCRCVAPCRQTDSDHKAWETGTEHLSLWIWLDSSCGVEPRRKTCVVYPHPHTALECLDGIKMSCISAVILSCTVALYIAQILLKSSCVADHPFSTWFDLYSKMREEHVVS